MKGLTRTRRRSWRRGGVEAEEGVKNNRGCGQETREGVERRGTTHTLYYQHVRPICNSSCGCTHAAYPYIILVRSLSPCSTMLSLSRAIFSSSLSLWRLVWRDLPLHKPEKKTYRSLLLHICYMVLQLISDIMLLQVERYAPPRLASC